MKTKKNSKIYKFSDNKNSSSNPFKDKNKHNTLLYKFGFVIIIISLFFTFKIILFHNFFQVKFIHTSGLQRIEEQEIQDAVYGIMTSAILTSTATSVAPCNEAVTPSSGVSGTVRSPVTIHAYDENGNHVGLENGILVNEIGNDVFYSLESGYETIKIMGNRKITFKIIGTADGEFGFDFLKWKEDGTKTEKSFENITISEGGGYSIDASQDSPELVKEKEGAATAAPACLPAFAIVLLLSATILRNN